MKASATKCPAEFTLAMIGGRWKIPIVFHLLAGRKRFSDLARSLDRRIAKNAHPAAARNGTQRSCDAASLSAGAA